MKKIDKLETGLQLLAAFSHILHQQLEEIEEEIKNKKSINAVEFMKIKLKYSVDLIKLNTLLDEVKEGA